MVVEDRNWPGSGGRLDRPIERHNELSVSGE